MSVTIIRGDARRLPLPDESVDLVVTSPPYFALRSYSDGGQHYDGQIGSEPTPQEFLEALWECTAEMMRVLKPSGSIFINLGDKYAGSREDGSSAWHTATLDGDPQKMMLSRRSSELNSRRLPSRSGMRPKSLMLLPERYRIGCVDRLGLTARAVIVWDKPNGLPESVQDRVRRSHEDWVHLTKQPRYYSAVDEIREPHTGSSHEAGPNAAVTNWESGNGVKHRTGRTDKALFNPLGKLPGSVWTIPSEPLTVPDHLGIDHFAAYPTAWPKRLIRGWSPPGICLQCGEGRRPVSTTGEVERTTARYYLATRQRLVGPISGGIARTALGVPAVDRGRAILGYVCACTPHTDHPGSGGSHKRTGNTMLDGEGWASTNELNGSYQNYQRVGPWREYHFDRWTPAPTRPAVILDPFSGTGTTTLVASALGRIGISVDLSHDYCRLAQWRTTDRAQIAKVLEVPKPPPVPAGQITLFDGEAAS